MRAPVQQASNPPLWLRFIFWCVRMAFLSVLFAWIGRSLILLNAGERDVYFAFQRGLVLVPDTLLLAWQEVLTFTAPLRDQLFPEPPVFIGIEETPPSSAMLPQVSFTLSPSLVQSCVWIAGAQALVTLWVLIARRDAARMWTGPGVLAVLEPRARVMFYGVPLAITAYEFYRAWPTQTGEALMIAAFALALRFFPLLTGLPFWLAEDVLGLNFSSLRTFSFVPRFPQKSSSPSKKVFVPSDAPRPDYPSALALLSLAPDCSEFEAMESYRAHMRMNHPGRGGSQASLRQLNEAFEAIKRVRGWA